MGSTLLSEHNNLFKDCDYDIFSLIRRFKNNIEDRRISIESVLSTVSSSNPEKEKLLLLVQGMPLFVSPDFIPNAPVVNRMLFEDFVDQGLAFILHKDLVCSTVPSFHLSKLSWTTKVGKKKGRPLLDCLRLVLMRKFLLKFSNVLPRGSPDMLIFVLY